MEEGLDDAGGQLSMRKGTAPHKMWPWLCGVKGSDFFVQEMPGIRKRTVRFPCLGRIWPDERRLSKRPKKERRGDRGHTYTRLHVQTQPKSVAEPALAVQQRSRRRIDAYTRLGQRSADYSTQTLHERNLRVNF